MARDAMGSSMRRAGTVAASKPRPLQAALTSAASFAAGAMLPLCVVGFAPARYLMASIAITCLLCLLILGGWSAQVGGANVRIGALRVAFWSALAMAVTSAVGAAAGAL